MTLCSPALPVSFSFLYLYAARILRALPHITQNHTASCVISRTLKLFNTGSCHWMTSICGMHTIKIERTLCRRLSTYVVPSPTLPCRKVRRHNSACNAMRSVGHHDQSKSLSRTGRNQTGQEESVSNYPTRVKRAFY